MQEKSPQKVYVIDNSIKRLKIILVFFFFLSGGRSWRGASAAATVAAATMLSLIWRRNWALRLSIVLNVCVLLYVCAHFGAVSGPWYAEDNNWGTAGGTAELVYNTAPRPNATLQTAVDNKPAVDSKILEIRPNETKTAPAVSIATNEIISPDNSPENKKLPTSNNNQTVRPHFLLLLIFFNIFDFHPVILSAHLDADNLYDK